MATATLSDIHVTETWVNIVAANASLANADVCIQNISAFKDDEVYVVFGGVSAPTSSTTGATLKRLHSVTGNAAAIWVRALGKGKIGAIIL